MLTTHRIVFVKDDQGWEIPLHYVGKLDTGGGMFHSYRIEVVLDQRYLKQWSPHIVEHYNKVLEADVPQFNMWFGDIEYHMKKFPNKDSRNKYLDHLKEALVQKAWTKLVVTQKK